MSTPIAITTFDQLAEALQQRVSRRIERVTLSDGTTCLRVKLNRKQVVTLKLDFNAPGYVVKSLRQGMCADVYTDDLARGLDTAAAVETFARFVAEAPRHRG